MVGWCGQRLWCAAAEDSSAATAWRSGAHSQDHGSAQDTEWTQPRGSLRVNVSRLLQRVVQREAYVSSANQTTQRRTEHLCFTMERDEEERESVLAAKSSVVPVQAGHEENEATRLPTPEAAADAAASVTAALDRWQAADTSWRRAVEASKKSAEALHKAQRESEEVCDNLLLCVEEFDKQIHSIPCAKTAWCWERMGGFATHRDR